MFDPISLAIGGGLLAVGWFAGRLTRRSGTIQKPANAICGCTHDLALHDLTTNECHDTTERALYKKRDWAGTELVRCTCRRHTGPQPVEEFFARPVLPPTE